MADNKSYEFSPEDLKKLQLTGLEMLIEIDRICRQNGIEYSIDGGTLLGAMRHGGFIPWDDDVDVIMERPEYVKFREVCENELDTERFFLQDYTTDPEYRWGYAKIRRKETSYIRAGQEEQKWVDGIFLDIFILDPVSDNPVARWFNYGLNVIARKLLYSSVGRYSAPNALLRGWYNLLYHIPRGFSFGLRDLTIRPNRNKNTELLSHILYPYPKKEHKYGMPRKSIEGYKDIEFDGLTFRSVGDPNLYLSCVYGDYMTIPPKEKQLPHNDASSIKFVDLDEKEIRARKI